MDFTNGSGFCKLYCRFHKWCCGFRKVACFWSNFEQYSVLTICPWSPKQQRRLKKKQKKMAILRVPHQFFFGQLRNPHTIQKFLVWHRKDFSIIMQFTFFYFTLRHLINISMCFFTQNAFVLTEFKP